LTAAVSRRKGNTRSACNSSIAGRSRKLANCQQGVFLVYASSRGHTFLDRRLYIPQTWFDEAHAAKRRKCGLPEKLAFKTEPSLGLEMIKALKQAGIAPFRWVNADGHYGMNPDFLDGVAELE